MPNPLTYLLRTVIAGFTAVTLSASVGCGAESKNLSIEDCIADNLIEMDFNTVKALIPPEYQSSMVTHFDFLQQFLGDHNFQKIKSLSYFDPNKQGCEDYGGARGYSNRNYIYLRLPPDTDVTLGEGTFVHQQPYLAGWDAYAKEHVFNHEFGHTLFNSGVFGDHAVEQWRDEGLFGECDFYVDTTGTFRDAMGNRAKLSPCDEAEVKVYYDGDDPDAFAEEVIVDRFAMMLDYSRQFYQLPSIDPFFEYVYLPLAQEHPSLVPPLIDRLHEKLIGLNGGQDDQGLMVELVQYSRGLFSEDLYNRRLNYYVNVGSLPPSSEVLKSISMREIITAADAEYDQQLWRELDRLDSLSH